MIKGILALFTSGAILNPMILFGIFTGFLFSWKLTGEQIMELYFNPRFYALIFLVATGYTFLFKKIYKQGGYELDTGACWIRVVASMGRFFLSNLLSLSFVQLISLA